MISKIGKYEIISVLGRGSGGVVYKAKDLEIGRLVAVKTFAAEQKEESLEHFRSELGAAARLRHPNIITILEIGQTEDEIPFTAMEFILGRNLESILREQKTLDIRVVLHLTSQIASALDYAHSQNIIHRDIKPSNILVDRELRAYLGDFGISSLGKERLTKSLKIVGSPTYMSPEQLRGEIVDHRSDIFSFGILAYQLIAGKAPFAGNSAEIVIDLILHSNNKIEYDNSIFPNASQRIFSKALNKNKEERFGSALEFIYNLAETFDLMVDGRGLVGGVGNLNLKSDINSEIEPLNNDRFALHPTQFVEEKVVRESSNKIKRSQQSTPVPPIFFQTLLLLAAILSFAVFLLVSFNK